MIPGIPIKALQLFENKTALSICLGSSFLQNISHILQKRRTVYGCGYVRVSTREQNEARQLAAMGVSWSGGGKHHCGEAVREGLQAPRDQRPMRARRPEDVLVMKGIDRLGRNYERRKAAIVVTGYASAAARPGR